MKASLNPFPKITLAESASPGTPSSGQGYIYASTGGTAYFVNDAGTETALGGGGGGAVATDSIWDAAGDLAVGSGANTAARLAIGNAGGAVSRINGAVAWNSGTAFPTAATGDRYWRTDIGLEFYYDGTRWVSSQLLAMQGAWREYVVGSGANADATGVGRFTIPYFGTYSLWLVRADLSTLVLTTNDGSKYWTVTANWLNAGGTASSLGSFTTASDTHTNYVPHLITIGAVLDASARSVAIAVAKTSTPGNLLIWGGIYYRVIAT